VSHMPGIAWFLVPVTVCLLALAGCGTFTPATLSPLMGTWYGSSHNPGDAFTGKIVFDFMGHLNSLDITSPRQRLWLVFDGAPHLDDQNNTYSATANTDLNGDTFVVKGFVEYTEGKHEGLTYITVEGTVGGGAMEGRLTIDYPGNESLLFYFDARRS
jgi:hypothetical protein